MMSLRADEAPVGAVQVVPAHLPGLPAKNLTVDKVLTCVRWGQGAGQSATVPWLAAQCCCLHSQRSCRHQAARRATLQRATISATQHAWLAR